MQACTHLITKIKFYLKAGNTPIALIAALHFGYVLVKPLSLLLAVLSHVSRKVVKVAMKEMHLDAHA